MSGWKAVSGRCIFQVGVLLWKGCRAVEGLIGSVAEQRGKGLLLGGEGEG